MKLFDFTNQQQKKDLKPEQILRNLVDNLPDFCKTQRQFHNCLEYLDNNEWELALDSLIELADETEHNFSENYWNELAESANKMNLTDKANYCKRQIKRND